MIMKDSVTSFLIRILLRWRYGSCAFIGAEDDLMHLLFLAQYSHYEKI